MVGRKIALVVEKDEAKPTDVVLDVKNLTVKSKLADKYVNNVSFNVRKVR